jgi:capsular exopolysaccharide synthesis family protein
LYLLQKREELAISLSVTAPNAKVIDAARATSAPVSPIKYIVYILFFAGGILLPISLIYILDLFDTKIKYRQDIEGKIIVPFLGDVPESDTEDEIFKASSRSSSAEAIRIVRTNLDFMLGAVPDGLAKTVFVTSTLPKEGKTFVTMNLASTIAMTNKKVLLIGLDIRNPKIDRYVTLPSKGLTNYLAKQNENINDYIVKIEELNNLFILPSGVIPPNPVDLLMNSKLGELFAQLKTEYDYIVVYTAPITLVTDTTLVAKY